MFVIKQKLKFFSFFDLICTGTRSTAVHLSKTDGQTVEDAVYSKEVKDMLGKCIFLITKRSRPLWTDCC